MSTFKDVLCLLAIFVLYGIAGRLDYEDAVGLEQIRQERLHTACLTDPPAGHEALARINRTAAGIIGVAGVLILSQAAQALVRRT